jgi:hypothetical protein
MMDKQIGADQIDGDVQNAVLSTNFISNLGAFFANPAVGFRGDRLSGRHPFKDRFGVGIFIQQLQSVSVIGADNRIATDTNTCRLT